MEIVIDVIVYLTILTIPLFFVTFYIKYVYPFLILIILFLIIQGYRKFEPQWLNWFEIGKLLGGIVGVISIVSMQMNIIVFNYNILYVILVFNILEAVVCDITKHGIYGILNSISGILIIINLQNKGNLCNGINKHGILQFNTSWLWIYAYTIWNIVFSYGFGYSMTTRLVLIPPLIICFIVNNPNIWLVPRAWSLLFNMGFRASQILWIFKPGQSLLTNNINYNTYNITKLGLFSFIFTTMLLNIR